MNAIAAVLAGLTGRPVEARLALTRPSALHPVLAAAVPRAAPPPNTRTWLTVAAEEAGTAASLLQIGNQTGGQTHLVRQTVKSVMHPDRQSNRQTDAMLDAGLIRTTCSCMQTALQPMAISCSPSTACGKTHFNFFIDNCAQTSEQSHMLLTTHGVVCLRSVGKLTSSTVLLGQTCPCGCLQSKQLPWKEDSQSEHYLTVASVTVIHQTVLL